MAKKKKKKKKTKEELEEEAEKKRLEREQILQEQRQFIDLENKRNEERIKLDARQQEARLVQLQNSINKFAALEDLMLDEELESRHLREWNLYIKDDRLPNPPIVPEMNTYLHRWHIDDSTYDIENIPKKTDEALSLLKILEEFMDFPLNATERLIENWKEVHTHFCSELRRHFDVATYRILRFVEERMLLKGLNEYSFLKEADNFVLFLWTILPLPKPMVAVPPHARDCNIPVMGATLTIPGYLSKVDIVARGLYVSYDHFSPLCRSNENKTLPPYMRQDMVQKAEYERNHTIKIQEEVVNTRLKKLNELRKALIAQATEYNAQILDDEASKAAGKDKKPKEKKKKDKDVDPKVLEMKKRDELINNLMKELELEHLGSSVTPGSKSGTKDDSSKKSSGSKKSTSTKKSTGSKKSGKKKKKKKKKKGPEKDFWKIIEKLKSIPEQKSAAEVFAEQEDEEDASFKEIFCFKSEPGELNLRKYAIIGGVLLVDLLLLLPQPYQHAIKYLLSVINLPAGLTPVYDEDLQPPEEEEETKKEEKPVARKSTLQQISAMLKSLTELKDIQRKEKEEEEAGDTEKRKDSEAKEDTKKTSKSLKQSRESTMESSKEDSKSKKDKKKSVEVTKSVSYSRRSKDPDATRASSMMTEEERKMFRLTSMIEYAGVKEDIHSLVYPRLKVMIKNDVVYFETPVVVLWEEEKHYWTFDHCLHVNANKTEATFQLKKFGPVAFATLRFSNLPFQSWDLRPDVDDKAVELYIRARYIGVVFKIKERSVILKRIEKLPKNVLDDVIGKSFRPRELIKIMRKKGLDIFPEDDTYCHVPESSPKYNILEEHLYHCMAILSGVFNFHWSRWNILQARRNIVILMRQFLDRWHPVNYNTIFVSPLRVGPLDLNEWSPEYKEDFIPGIKFYADLHNYVSDNVSLNIQKKLRLSSTSQIETVYEMLCRTKVISYTTSYPEQEKIPFISHQMQPPKETKKKKGKKGKGKKGKGKKGKGKKKGKGEGKEEGQGDGKAEGKGGGGKAKKKKKKKKKP